MIRVPITAIGGTKRIIVAALIAGALLGCEPKPRSVAVPQAPPPASEPIKTTPAETKAQPNAAPTDPAPAEPDSIRARREAAKVERDAGAGANADTPLDQISIDRAGPHHFKLKRESVDAMLENQAGLMGSVRVVPERRDDKWVGLTLGGIGEGSLFHRLGFRDEDVILAVGGHPVHAPDKALEAYAKLRAADRIDVKVQRGGDTIVLRYDIEAAKP